MKTKFKHQNGTNMTRMLMYQQRYRLNHSLLQGMSTLYGAYGHMFSAPFLSKSDLDEIKLDWMEIGLDLHDALDKYQLSM